MKRNASVKSVIYSELLILTRESLKKVILMHPDFAIKLFSYLKKKTSSQIKSRNQQFPAKFKWSFLILMLKTAKNLCKLSDKTLKIDVFFNKSISTIIPSNNVDKINKLIKLQKNEKNEKNAVFPHKKSNMYSGIRELSEFVMTKTMKNEEITKENPRDMGYMTPKQVLGRDMGYMTPKQALKFTFTVNKPQTIQKKKENF